MFIFNTLTSILQLINSAHTFSLKTRAPQLDLSLGLGKSFQCIRLALMFIFNTLTSILQFSAKVLEFAQQSRTVTAFRLSHALGIFKLGGQRNLALVKTSHGIFTLLNLALKILLLNVQTLLLRVSLIQSTSHLIQFLVGVNNGSLKELSIFIQLSLLTDSILQ